MIKVGLIGAGYMGNMHSKCYEVIEGAQIVAIADLSEDKSKNIIGNSNVKIYKDGMDLINNANVDIIDICLPTYLHTQHAIAAMKAKKAVFIEKPVCLNDKEMKVLLETEKQMGVKVMVGHCIRMWDEYEWLKQVVDNKKYGKIISGIFNRISPLPTWSWENWLHTPSKSGGVALDMHIHDVDYIRYIMGEPLNVNAVASRDNDGVIQQMFTTYEYKNAIIQGEVCWNYPSDFPFKMEYRVKFEKATVVYDSNAKPTLMVYLDEGGSISPKMDKKHDKTNDIGGNVSSLGGYYKEIKYFVDCVKEDKVNEIAPLSEGVKSVKLALKEIKSAGGVVKK